MLQVLSVLNLGVHPFSAARNICVALVSMFSYFCCSCVIHAPCLEAAFCKLAAASTRNCSWKLDVTDCMYFFFLLGMVDLSSLEVEFCGMSGVWENRV